jgi:hypothetical protein
LTSNRYWLDFGRTSWNFYGMDEYTRLPTDRVER